MLSVHTLFSGSDGNCIYVKNEDTEILIDAGKSCASTEKALNALGTSLCNIKEIFVTHEHSDHIAGLEVISKKHIIPVNITAPSYDKCIKSGSHLEYVAQRQAVTFEKDVGSLSIRAFPVPHDSVQNVGYVISSRDDTFGIATDIGRVTPVVASNLSLCKRAIVESNHDISMVENGPYPRFLKERILSDSGHLSNEKCAMLCAYLCEMGVCELTLAHLSKENNLPKLAYDTVKTHLTKCGFENVPLKIAFADITVCATNGKSYPLR